MDLMIKIDDKELEQAILKEFKDLSKDQLQEVTVKAFESYLTKDTRVIDKLVFEESSYGFNRSKPSKFFTELVSGFDDEELDKLRKLILDYVNNNYKELAMNALVIAFTNQLVNHEFSDSLKSAFGEINTRLNTEFIKK